MKNGLTAQNLKDRRTFAIKMKKEKNKVGRLKGFCNNKNHKWVKINISFDIPYCSKCGKIRNSTGVFTIRDALKIIV